MRCTGRQREREIVEAYTDYMISIWIITIEEHKSRKRELDVTYLEVLVPYGPNDCLSGRVYTLLIGTDRGVPMP